MAATPQVIRTGLTSFWLAFAFAWVAWTLTLCAVVYPARSREELPEQLLMGLPAVLAATATAGAAGAMLGLLLGSPLSPHYAGLFGAMIGSWLAPVVMVALLYNLRSITVGGMHEEALFSFGWLAFIMLGWLAGYLRSLRKAGYGGASRRAAAVGLVVGLFAAVLCGVAFVVLLQPTVQHPLPWGLIGLLAVCVLLSAPCVFATRAMDRAASEGFFVATAKPDSVS